MSRDAAPASGSEDKTAQTIKFALGLTHACNMGCRYCYAGRSSKPDISLPVLRQAIQFFWNQSKEGDLLEIGFFGGEPLLRPDLIRHAVTMVNEQQQSSPRRVTYQLTTNGTLLNNAMLDLIQEEEIAVCVSLDGPPDIQDFNRPLRNGQGSSQLVMEHVRLALQRLEYLQVNTVYGPDTLHQLPETLLFLQELGVSSIHFNPNIRADWATVQREAIAEVFHHLADLYIQSYARGEEVGVNLLDSKILLYLKQGYTPADRCGMGRTEWAIAPSGNVYPCERLIGNDDNPALQLGHVQGSVRTLPCPGSLTPPHRTQKAPTAPNCAQCPVQNYCMHWCGCTNFHLTGNAELPAPIICALERAALKAASHALNTLSEPENPLFVRHFMAFIQP
ncbi:MAG: radical SAM protein [Magnetococcus sp. XQGC-1]